MPQDSPTSASKKSEPSDRDESDERQRTMAYLLFGIDLGAEQETTAERPLSGKGQTAKKTLVGRSDQGERVKGQHDVREGSHQKLKAVLDQIDRQIPKDPTTLRETPLFRAALHAVQWQRDNYLAGQEYADWRKRDKDRGRINPSSYRIPYDSNALVHPQLRPILADFIPSETVSRALAPIVADLPSGIMYDTISDSTIDIIRSQRYNLNVTVKSQLLTFLRDPSIRNKIKSSTQGLIIDKTEHRGNPG